MFHAIVLLALSILPLVLAALYLYVSMDKKDAKAAILSLLFWGGITIMMAVVAGREWMMSDIQRWAKSAGYIIEFKSPGPARGNLIIKKIEKEEE